MTVGYLGSLTCAQIWGLAVRDRGEGGAGTHMSAQEGEKNLSFTLPHQGIKPRVYKSDIQTTELCPPLGHGQCLEQIMFSSTNTVIGRQ